MKCVVLVWSKHACCELPPVQGVELSWQCPWRRSSACSRLIAMFCLNVDCRIQGNTCSRSWSSFAPERFVKWRRCNLGTDGKSVATRACSTVYLSKVTTLASIHDMVLDLLQLSCTSEILILYIWCWLLDPRWWNTVPISSSYSFSNGDTLQ